MRYIRGGSPRSVTGMASSVRPGVLGAIFGAYFAVIFLAAWFFSQGLSSGWYDADLSYKVYAGNLIAAAALIVGLGGIALSRSQFLDRRLVELNDKMETAGVADAALAAAPDGLPPPLPEAPVKDHVDRDIDDLLESLSEMETTTVKEAEELETVTLPGAAPGEGQAIPTKEVEWDLAKKVDRVRRMRRSVPGFLVGPSAVAVLVAGISGIMLPAVGGLLQSYANLNTALILSFSYWWPGLGAYVVASTYALLKQR